MKCKYCKEHDAEKYSKYASGKFCSKHCAKSYSSNVKREEVNEKVSLTLKKKFASGELKSNLNENRYKPDVVKNHSDAIKAAFERKDLLIKQTLPFEKWPVRLQKRYVFKKYGNVCQECGYQYTDKKTGKGPFEIHHIDGNHDNWKEENLNMLCLNCHWKTPNWRFRGKTHSKETRKILSKISTAYHLKHTPD